MTNAGCGFICSDKYLIDPVHPADANTPPHTHTNTDTLLCYLSCSNYTAGANRGCNVVTSLRRWMCSCDHDCTYAACVPGLSFVKQISVLQWREADCWIPIAKRREQWGKSSSEPDSSSGSWYQTEIHPSTVTVSKKRNGSESEALSVFIFILPMLFWVNMKPRKAADFAGSLVPSLEWRSHHEAWILGFHNFRHALLLHTQNLKRIISFYVKSILWWRAVLYCSCIW